MERQKACGITFAAMNRLVVDEQARLREFREGWPEQPAILKGIARAISWLFHPVFLPVYLMLFLTYEHPYLFAGFNNWHKARVVMMALLLFTFFPIVTLLLLKGLKFIDSIYLRTQKDRVIPFIATMIWYFWIWYVWKNMANVPDALEMPGPAVQFALACFISTILGLMMNIRMKISLHAIAAGVVVTFMFLLAFNEGFHFGTWLALSIFMAGSVCTSRLIVSDHSAEEIYVGLLTGVVSMLLASWLG
jgi:hypothetical protein